MKPSQLNVEITESLSKKLEVKYTVKTTTNLIAYEGNEFSVSRSHGEFVWLYTSLLDNQNHAGLIIPPKPIKPDMTETR